MRFLQVALAAACAGVTAAKAVPNAAAAPTPTPAITPPPKPRLPIRPARKRDLGPRATDSCPTECGLYCCEASEKCINDGFSASCVDAAAAELFSSALGGFSFDVSSLNNDILTNAAYFSSIFDSLYSYSYPGLDSSIRSGLPTYSIGGDVTSYLSAYESYAKTAYGAAGSSPTGSASSAGQTDSSGSSSGSKSGGGKKSNTGAIVGGAVGGVAALAIIGAIIFFVVRKRNKPKPVTLPPGHIPTAYQQNQQHQQPPPPPPPGMVPAGAVEGEKPQQQYYNPAPPAGVTELPPGATQKVDTAPPVQQQWTGSTVLSQGQQPVPQQQQQQGYSEVHGQSAWVPPADGTTQPVEMYAGQR